MEILAIIPARGGSKEIPRKNIIEFCGEPLVGHVIKTVKQSKRITRLIVSTDDTEIAKVSLDFGAEICMRPSEISQDDSPSELALLHTLEQLKLVEYIPDLLVFIQCTSPLILPEDIDGIVDSIIKHNADTALTVTPFSHFLWKKNGDGINHYKSTRQRRQNIKDQFLETGGIYVMRTDKFIIHKHRFFGHTILYEIPKERSFEIDSPLDLCLAKCVCAI